MKKTRFRGRIKGGRLDKTISRQIADLFGAQKDGYEVQITVEKPGDYRSVKANAYYWGVVIDMIATETGYYKDEIHDAYKQFMAHNLYDWMYAEDLITLSSKPNEQPKDRRLRSTSDYSSWEFWTYIEAVRTHAANFFGLDIPDPMQLKQKEKESEHATD